MGYLWLNPVLTLKPTHMKKLIIILLAATALISCRQDVKQIARNTANILTTENLPSSVFSIASDRDTVISGNGGTQIRIKANSFADKSGKLFQGRVDIELKEAITNSDIVLGNMTTLSNGRVLESGGMIYLNATSKINQLSIAENSSIEVSVPADVVNDSMQIYSAEKDSSSNEINWINPKDDIVKAAATDSLNESTAFNFSPEVVANDTIDLFTEDAESIPVPPKPQEHQGGDTTISLIFDSATFPEFSEYRNVEFKFKNGNEYNPDDAHITWFSIDLKKAEEKGFYTIKFQGWYNEKLIERNYTVTPVFEGADYKTAMEKYNETFKNFEKKKKKIELAKIEAEKERIKTEKKQQIEWQKAQRERIVQMKKQVASQSISNTNSFSTDKNVRYVFILKDLGWANIDILYDMPNTKLVDLETSIENNKEYDVVYISLIFNKVKIYLPGYKKSNNTYSFTHGNFEAPRLPVGESALIIATAYKDGVPFLAIQPVIIEKKQKVSLQLKETTADKLKAEIKARI
jgi:hypothetical protein